MWHYTYMIWGQMPIETQCSPFLDDGCNFSGDQNCQSDLEKNGPSNHFRIRARILADAIKLELPRKSWRKLILKIKIRIRTRAGILADACCLKCNADFLAIYWRLMRVTSNTFWWPISAFFARAWSTSAYLCVTSAKSSVSLWLLLLLVEAFSRALTEHTLCHV